MRLHIGLSFAASILANAASASAQSIRAPASAQSADPFIHGITAYVTGDYATALRLLRPLADHGDPAAQATLGDMYANGEGVAKDYAEALRWYRLSAAKGDAPAQYALGVMYENGEGVIQDKVEALRWYRLSAAKANSDGNEITASDAKKAIDRLTESFGN